MFMRVLVCCVAIGIAMAAAVFVEPALSQEGGPAANCSSEPLIGLWTAQRRFNSFTRATLTIRRTDSGYVADMLGHTLPVRVDGSSLSFELPNDEGAFRGTLSGAITGHWHQAAEQGM